MFQVNFIQRKNSSLLLGAGGSEKSTYETVKKQTGVILKNHWVCMKQLIHNAFFFLFQLLPVAEIMGHVSFSDISSLSLSSDKHSVMSLKER